MPSVTIYVKANAKDGKGIGDCPFSHRILMIMKLKAIAGEYVPVHMTPVSPIFKDFCLNAGIPVKVPVFKHDEYVVYNVNDITYYIDKEWPEPNLKSTNALANTVADHLFTRFAGCIRNKDPNLDEKLQASLLEELKKINNFLGSSNSPGKYLDGDTLKHPDCDILPKLQIVKVALKKYKNFDIPEDLVDLHKYMKDAAEEPAFKSTCPTDEAIIEGWKKHFS